MRSEYRPNVIASKTVSDRNTNLAFPRRGTLRSRFICTCCGSVKTVKAESATCCGKSMLRLKDDHYHRICHWTKIRRLDWIADDGPNREPDDPRVIAASYLQKRTCPNCSFQFANIRASDLSRGLSPMFRCHPPVPTCWEMNCPNCNACINLAVRFDKVWKIER